MVAFGRALHASEQASEQTHADTRPHASVSARYWHTALNKA
jgi:hypothetical protein